MGTKFLMDTNATSDYLSQKLSIKGLDFIDLVVNEVPNMSVISRIELLGFISPLRVKIREFVEVSNVYDLDEAIIIQTIALRRQRKIKIPDAIIAATALVYDLTLITHNISDFEGISGLKIMDAHSL
jgi:predicted nucleic acid-binding protein